MEMNRVWAMPNKWTFRIKPIADLLARYVGDGKGWADPFAGQSTLAEYRNDLNPALAQPSCREASEFLTDFTWQGTALNGVIFDPPYSLTQVSRSYEEMGYKFKGKDDPTGGFTQCRDITSKIVRPDGYVISFGWNTVGMGKGRGFKIIEILDVCHGGNRNDTLVTVEQKCNGDE